MRKLLNNTFLTMYPPSLGNAWLQYQSPFYRKRSSKILPDKSELIKGGSQIQTKVCPISRHCTTQPTADGVLKYRGPNKQLIGADFLQRRPIIYHLHPPPQHKHSAALLKCSYPFPLYLTAISVCALGSSPEL